MTVQQILECARMAGLLFNEQNGTIAAQTLIRARIVNFADLVIKFHEDEKGEHDEKLS